MAKTLSIMNMIEMLFMNIDILRIKEWNNFMFTIRLASPRMMVYDNTNYSWWLQVFWMEMSSLSQEHCQLIQEISSHSWKCIFLFISWPLHRVQYKLKVQGWRQGEKVTEEWNRPTYSHEEYKQHQHSEKRFARSYKCH